MMKLGMPILFEYDNLEDNFILAHELGLDFVELNLNFSYCRKEMEEGKVADLLKKYNLEATCHFYDEADLGTYEEVVEAYLTLFEKYASLGKGYVKQYNFHNNGGPVVTISGIKNYIYAKEYEEYYPRLETNFRKAAAIAAKYDSRITIENVDTAKGADFLYENFTRLVSAGFHLCMDIGHDNVMGGPFEIIRNMYSLPLDEMHIHDGNGKTCHLALGRGNIDIAHYKEVAIENDAYVVLEVKSSEDLRTSVPYFRAL